eukprot:764076-Hanusia_phi.AAC.4
MGTVVGRGRETPIGQWGCSSPEEQGWGGTPAGWVTFSGGFLKDRFDDSRVTPGPRPGVGLSEAVTPRRRSL